MDHDMAVARIGLKSIVFFRSSSSNVISISNRTIRTSRTISCFSIWWMTTARTTTIEPRFHPHRHRSALPIVTIPTAPWRSATRRKRTNSTTKSHRRCPQPHLPSIHLYHRNWRRSSHSCRRSDRFRSTLLGRRSQNWCHRRLSHRQRITSFRRRCSAVRSTTPFTISTRSSRTSCRPPTSHRPSLVYQIITTTTTKTASTTICYSTESRATSIRNITSTRSTNSRTITMRTMTWRPRTRRRLRSTWTHRRTRQHPTRPSFATTSRIIRLIWAWKMRICLIIIQIS